MTPTKARRTVRNPHMVEVPRRHRAAIAAKFERIAEAAYAAGKRDTQAERIAYICAHHGVLTRYDYERIAKATRVEGA